MKKYVTSLMLCLLMLPLVAQTQGDTIYHFRFEPGNDGLYTAYRNNGTELPSARVRSTEQRGDTRRHRPYSGRRLLQLARRRNGSPGYGPYPFQPGEERTHHSRGAHRSLLHHPQPHLRRRLCDGANRDSDLTLRDRAGATGRDRTAGSRSSTSHRRTRGRTGPAGG